MENSPRHCGPGGQWLCFIFIWWGIVLIGICLRTLPPPPKKREKNPHVQIGGRGCKGAVHQLSSTKGLLA